MELSVFASQNCFFLSKIEAAAKICDVNLKVQEIAKAASKSMLFPCYPALLTPQGLIGGSNACLRYLANAFPLYELYGRSMAERADIDAALDAIYREVEVPLRAGTTGFDTKKVAEDLSKPLELANKQLTSNTFLIGQRMSIADIALAGAVRAAVEKGIVKTDHLPHLTRLVNTVAGRCGWKFRLSAQAPANENQAAPKKAVEAKEAAEPAEEKKEAPKKPQDPLDLLPPTDFDLDAWKRKYSNSKDLKGDAMPYLWQHLDKDGWSFWHLKYLRYNDQDNTKVFMASNLLGMFLQRIENSLRKYSFAVCDIFTETGYFDIEGVLLIRGSEIPFKLKDHVQYDSFEWTKLELPKDEKLITDFFCESDAINGRNIADCKVYK